MILRRVCMQIVHTHTHTNTNTFSLPVQRPKQIQITLYKFVYVARQILLAFFPIVLLLFMCVREKLHCLPLAIEMRNALCRYLTL